MNASSALEVVAYYEAVYSRTIPDEAKPLWISKLSPITQAEAIETIDQLASVGAFPPNVLQIVAEARRGDRLSAYEAWGNVTGEIRRIGIYGRPELEGITARAVDIIGWSTICNSSDEDTYMLEQFRRVYDSLTEAEDRRNGALAGGTPMKELEG